jgi:hypothetical protein
LIPDFGQTKYHPQIKLPEENSFTEGTDLFSKGDLVYSRRIEAGPLYTQQLTKIIIDNPSSVDLINALKVSGRTKDGLGRF